MCNGADTSGGLASQDEGFEDGRYQAECLRGNGARE